MMMVCVTARCRDDSGLCHCLLWRWWWSVSLPVVGMTAACVIACYGDDDGLCHCLL